MTRENILSYNIMTSIKGSSIIQIVGAESVVGLDSMRDQVSQRVMETQDAQTRKALIELGWMPPETTKVVTEALERALTELRGEG